MFSAPTLSHVPIASGPQLHLLRKSLGPGNKNTGLGDVGLPNLTPKSPISFCPWGSGASSVEPS